MKNKTFSLLKNLPVNKTQIKTGLSLFLLLPAFLFMGGCKQKKIDVNIIPEPLELKTGDGIFVIDEGTKIVVDSKNSKTRGVAEYFIDQFKTASGTELKITSERSNNSIVFSDKEPDNSLGKEGYTLKSNKNEIVLTGTPHGLFYGVQTLFQLLPEEIYKDTVYGNIEWAVPVVEIRDKPRFRWRGMHLDVGRHLFPVSFIKKYIDYIAMHKLNTFHWHLTEDQGWRIEIKKYPRLTETGAWRNGTQIAKTNKDDGIRYGGFYTQEEVKDIVKYASKRFVTVVPEIEMPGHSVAALAAYPELSCTGGTFEVRKFWGIDENIYCAGNKEVFTFLENVLDEVLKLFPSEYIHIGGDEAPKARWEKCPKCQLRIKREGLKDEHELQSYFITRIEKYLNSKGRKIIGWDEILEGGLAPNAAVMSWRGVEGGINAAKLKHNVVMTPDKYCYFDYYEGNPEDEPLAIGGYLPLNKVYSYEPVPAELTADEQKYIMGVQANQWTEYIATPELVEYMTLPRLCALSEIAWSAKENRDLEKFLDKMSIHYGRMAECGINFRWPALRGFRSNIVFINESVIDVKSGQKGNKIYYTTDGSEPTESSMLFTKPFELKKTTTVKFREYSPSGHSSRVYESHYVKEKPREPISGSGFKNGLKFQFFDVPKDIHSVEELQNLKPVKSGEVSKFGFPYDDKILPKSFGLVFYGYVKVDDEGVYTFSVNSNDGSRLFVADKMIVNNDGLHGAIEKYGEIALKPGWHKIELQYFQAGGGKDLNVYLKGTKSGKQEISDTVLGNAGNGN